MKSLTSRQVETLKPRPTRYEVGDGKGLYLSIMPSGHKSWVLRYKFKGVARKLTIGTTEEYSLAEARVIAVNQRELVRKGIDVQAAKVAAKFAAEQAQPVGDTVRQVVAQYLAKQVRRNNKPGTVAEYERLLAKDVVGPWGDRQIASITKRDVIEQLDVIIERGSKVGANRFLAVAKALFNWCIERDIIAVSPAARVKKPTKETGRARRLTLAEMRAIYAASDGLGLPYSAITKLMLLTACRRGEAAGLRWAELDLPDRTWTIPASRTKATKEHVVPLSPAAAALIENLPHIGDSPLAFPSNAGGELRAFWKPKLIIDQQVGFTDWTFHDFRTGITSALQEDGVPPHVTDAILGHAPAMKASSSTYHRYSYAKEQRAALDRWSAMLLEPPADDAAGKVVAMADFR